MIALIKNFYFKLFTAIFCTVSILFVILAETVWFPIRFHHTDNFIAYISIRKEPFDSFNWAFCHIYAYYLSVFCIMTVVHVMLYRFLWVRQSNRVWLLQVAIYLFGMFSAGYLLVLLNTLYIKPIYKGLFEWITEVFFDYLELIITDYNVILLYISISIILTIGLHYYYKRYIQCKMK
jgi:hypothetical protein